MTDRPGMTLVELLIVLILLAVLASIATIRTRGFADQARLSTLQADLRALALAEALYERTSFQYGDLPALHDYRTSEGVTVQITWLDPDGYAATAVHAGLPGVVCGLFLGPAPAGSAGPARDEGVIACQ